MLERSEIDEYVGGNYDRLMNFSRKIVLGAGRPEEEACDLLHWAVADAYDKMDRCLEKCACADDFERYLVKTMKNQLRWDVNSRNSYKKMFDFWYCELTPQMLDRMQAADADQETYEELRREVYRDDYLVELVMHGYTNEQISRILAARMARTWLRPEERSVFDMYFFGGMNIRDISRARRVSTRFVQGVLNDVKKKTREICDTLLN